MSKAYIIEISPAEVDPRFDFVPGLVLGL